MADGARTEDHRTDDQRLDPAASRPRLSRAAIVAAAVEMIERDGEESVSMRRLAAELGTGAMSLYTYLPSKAALMDAVAGYILAQMEIPAEAIDPGTDWSEQVRVLVHGFRDCARRYPRSMNVVLTRQLSSPAGLRPIERALATARLAGFEGEQAVRVMRVFVNYTLGTLTNELARAHRVTDLGGAAVGDLVDRLDRERFPNVRELAGLLAEVDDDVEFEFGLELLIRAVETLPRDPA